MKATDMMKMASTFSTTQNETLNPLGATQDESDTSKLNNSSPNSNAVTDLGMDEGEIAKMKKWGTAYRLYNIASTALMFAASILQLTSTDTATVFIAVYVFFFACLICCFEAAFRGVTRAIAQNFGFLYSRVGRIIFLIFVSMMCMKLGVLGYAACAFTLLSASIYIYMIFRFPKYAEFMRANHFNNVKN